MNHNLEYRSCNLMDVAVDNNKRSIVGRAVVYNSMSTTLRTSTGTEFREIIMPGALRESLETNDILALAHHDSAQILGRKSAGTLKMEDRADGLYVDISVPNTSYGNDLLVSAARGDISGFSFGFNSPKAKNYSRGGEKIREITNLNLREVSVVSSPAYSETTLALRNEDFVEEVVQNLDKEKGEEIREEVKPEVKTEEKIIEKVDHTRDIELLKWKVRLNEFNEAQPRAK